MAEPINLNKARKARGKAAATAKGFNNRLAPTGLVILCLSGSLPTCGCAHVGAAPSERLGVNRLLCPDGIEPPFCQPIGIRSAPDDAFARVQNVAPFP